MSEEPRSRWRRILKWLLIAILAFGVFAAIGIVLSQTGPGKRAVTHVIERQLSERLDMPVKIENVTGLVPFNMHIDSISIDDDKGRWLYIEDINLVMQGRRLLARNVQIDQMSAGLVSLERLPKSPPKQPDKDKPFSLPKLPKSLPDLDVDEFRVDRVVFGEAIYPDAASLNVKGQVSTDGAPRTMRANLSVEQLTGPPMTGAFNLTLTTEPPALDIDAEYNEPQDGPLTNVLGYDAGPTQIGVRGQGPLENWNGAVTVVAGGDQLVDIAVTTQGREQPVLQADGRVWAPPVVRAKADMPVLEVENQIALTARFVSAENIDIQQAAVTSALAAIRASGHIYPQSDTLDISFSANVEDLAATVPASDGQHVAGRVAATGTVTGAFGEPRVDVTLNGENVSFNKARAEAVSGDFVLVQGETMQFSGKGTTTNVAYGEAFAEEQLAWAFETEFGAGDTVVVETLSIEGRGLSVAGSGRYEGEAKAAKFDLTANVQELANLTDGQMQGAGNLSATGDIAVADGTGTAQIQGAFQGLAGLPDAPAALVGESLTVTGNLVLVDDVVRVSDLKVQGDNAALAAEGSYQTQSKAVDATWAFNMPELAPLASVLKRPVSGSLAVAGDVDGAYPVLAVTARIEGEKVLVDQQPLSIQTARLDARGVPDQPAGELALVLGWRGETLEAEAQFASEENELRLTPLRVQAPQTAVTGALTVNTETQIITGDLAAESDNLAWLGSLMGEPLAGAVSADVALNAVADKQAIEVEANAQSLESPWLNAETVAFKADINDARGTPSGTASLTLANAARDGLALDALRANVNGSLDKANMDLEASGTYRKPFNIDAAGTWAQSSFTLGALDGTWGEYLIETTEPLVVTAADKRVAASNVALRVGNGRIAGDLAYSPDSISAQATLLQFPLNVLPVSETRSLQGTAEGSLRVQGTPAAPQIQMDLRAINVEAVPSIEDLPLAEVTTNVSYSDNRMQVAYTIARIVDAPVTGTLSLPMMLSLSPFKAQVLRDQPLGGDLNFDGKLDALGALLELDTRRIAGDLEVAYRLDGTVAAPQLTGEASVSNGEFEDVVNGVTVQNIGAILRGDGLQLELVDVRATDASNGTLSATGRINLSPDEHYPLEASLTLENFAVVRRDDITASASGTVSIAGTAEQSKVGGDLTVGPAEIYLREPTPRAVVGLDVTEINVPGEPEVTEEPQPQAVSAADRPSALQNVALQVALSVPGHVNVRGYGIESEWQGDLDITGHAREPKVVGQIRLVRGRMTFLGRTFDLTEGTIALAGAVPPVPVIDLKAEADAEDITAVVAISGPVKSPTITLESTPPLPQDEILARLLFGRDVSSITPLQAVQLAQAANELAQGPGALNVLEQTRKALGLEMLSITEVGGGNGPAATGIEAGKYIGKGVHLQVEQGFGAESGKVKVKAEISENVSVESSVGQKSGADIELQWKKDY